jgi:hypothetical protein
VTDFSLRLSQLFAVGRVVILQARSDTEVLMAEHKFHIGQTLNFHPHRMSSQARPGKCKVIRLVSSEGDTPQYRVKCVAENFERVVSESELE